RLAVESEVAEQVGAASQQRRHARDAAALSTRTASPTGLLSIGRLAAAPALLIQCGLFRRGPLRLHEIVVEQEFEGLERPLRLVRFDVEYLPTVGALQGMRCEVPDPPDFVDGIREVGRQGRHDRADFVRQPAGLYLGNLFKEALKTTSAQRSAGLRAVDEDQRSLLEILREGFGYLGGYGTGPRLRPHHDGLLGLLSITPVA